MTDFNFVKSSANPQTADETTMVLAYEVAKIVESIWGKEDSGESKTYGKTECADAISMCRMLCEHKHNKSAEHQCDWIEGSGKDAFR